MNYIHDTYLLYLCTDTSSKCHVVIFYGTQTKYNTSWYWLSWCWNMCLCINLHHMSIYALLLYIWFVNNIRNLICEMNKHWQAYWMCLIEIDHCCSAKCKFEFRVMSEHWIVAKWNSMNLIFKSGFVKSKTSVSDIDRIEWIFLIAVILSYVFVWQNYTYWKRNKPKRSHSTLIACWIFPNISVFLSPNCTNKWQVDGNTL